MSYEKLPVLYQESCIYPILLRSGSEWPKDQAYSRVQKSWTSFFSKILEKPTIVQKKNDTSYKWAGFFTDMKQKKVQNGRLKKFKMAASKKAHFPAPPILNIFS